MSRDKGSDAENRAQAYLENHGLKHLRSNYHCRFGELDLIMVDGDELVFVEVRYRDCPDFGRPEETVTGEKRRKIAKTADHFLSRHHRWQHSICRFDVVSVEPRAIEWFKDAFEAAPW